MSYQSISELLEAHGWTAEDAGYGKDHLVMGFPTYHEVIAPEEWVGLSVDAFLRKAKLRRWVPLDPAKSMRENLGDDICDQLRQEDSWGQDAMREARKVLCAHGWQFPPGAEVRNLYLDGEIFDFEHDATALARLEKKMLSGYRYGRTEGEGSP